MPPSSLSPHASPELTTNSTASVISKTSFGPPSLSMARCKRLAPSDSQSALPKCTDSSAQHLHSTENDSRLQHPRHPRLRNHSIRFTSWSESVSAHCRSSCSSRSPILQSAPNSTVPHSTQSTKPPSQCWSLRCATHSPNARRCLTR